MIKQKIQYYSVFIYEKSDQPNAPSVFLPDVPGCHTCATSDDEGIKMAEEVLQLCLHKKNINTIPYANKPADITDVIPFVVTAPIDKNGVIRFNASDNKNHINFCFNVVLIYGLNETMIFPIDVPDCNDLMNTSGYISYFLPPKKTLNMEDFQKKMNHVIVDFLDNKNSTFALTNVRSTNVVSKIHLIEVDANVDDFGIISFPEIVEF